MDFRTSDGRLLRVLLTGTALAVLAGCSGGFDPDMRGMANGFSTAPAARQAAERRPDTDNRGVISYPTYQVAVARRGDTVATVASRVGLGADELARYNGLTSGDTLRQNEVLALPRRVAEPTGSSYAAAPGTTGGSMTTAPTTGNIDVTSIATTALDRVDGGSAAPSGTQTAAAAPVTTPPAAGAPTGATPVRHKVVRGETVYSIARLYNVSVRSLAEWNGLGPDLAVREGQYLLIPTAATPAAAAPQAQATTPPGSPSPTPPPPSSKEPLPAQDAKPVTPKDLPPSPNLETKATSSSKLQMPVAGKIIRPYSKSKNEGIDIGASAGATVVAAASGSVAAITRDTDQVPIIVLRHPNNLLTVYAGLDAITVKKGDSVTRGQKLGVVRAGNPAFVHFEVREGFESTDPVPYLQ